MTDKIENLEFKPVKIEAFHFNAPYEQIPDAIAELVAWLGTQGVTITHFSWKVSDRYPVEGLETGFEVEVELSNEETFFRRRVGWDQYVVVMNWEKPNQLFTDGVYVMPRRVFESSFQEAGA